MSEVQEAQLACLLACCAHYRKSASQKHEARRIAFAIKLSRVVAEEHMCHICYISHACPVLVTTVRNGIDVSQLEAIPARRWPIDDLIYYGDFAK